MIYELFGWDLVEEAPRDNFDSVFGKPSAFCMGIEEQACHSLHVHILLWIKEINELRIALCSGISTVQQQQKAKLLIAQYFDNIGVLQIRILVIFSLTSGYQPILTKLSANVAYFLKLNLTFSPKIMNELISNICSEVIEILLDMCK